VSVRRQEYRDRKTGEVKEHWIVDVSFEHADGRVERKRKVSPVQTRRGAEHYERDLRQKLLEGEHRPERKEVPTLAGFWEDFMRRHARPNNKPSEIAKKESVYEHHLCEAFGRMRLDQIKALHVDDYKAAKSDDLEPKTINNHLTILRTALGCAVRWELIAAVPAFDLLDVPKQGFDFLSFEEAEALTAGASGEAKAMVAVALNAGLRVSELIALRWADVGLQTRTLTVARSDWRGEDVTPKGGDTVTLPLNDVALAALKDHRHLRGPLVFSRFGGLRYSYRQADGILERACREAGIRHVRWHVLRHTFASHLVMRGAPIKAVQELMRHADIKTTMRYAHLSPGVTDAAVGLLTQPAPQWQTDGKSKAASDNSK
jgi:integrase